MLDLAGHTSIHTGNTGEDCIMYGNPPDSTKFKPAQSGNPKGRPKRLNEQDMASMIHHIMRLYADAKSNDKTIRSPACQKLQELKKLLS